MMQNPPSEELLFAQDLEFYLNDKMNKHEPVMIHGKDVLDYVGCIFVKDGVIRLATAENIVLTCILVVKKPGVYGMDEAEQCGIDVVWVSMFGGYRCCLDNLEKGVIDADVPEFWNVRVTV